MRATLATIALIAGTATSAAAFQTPPRDVPGYHRIVVGDFTVTALNDGVVQYRTAQLLPTAPSDMVARRLAEAGLSDPWGMSYNAYLVDTGEKQILIDTGSGGKLAESPFFAGTGRVLANLKAAGYQPEQIDEIYITHLGPDHIGGLVQGTGRVFSNAILRASESEVAPFMKPGALEANPKNALLRFYHDLFQPYVDAGKWRPFEADGPLASGIRAMATRGHTAGHTSYLVESQGQKLLVLGDVMLVAAIQFAEPELPSSFDQDQPAGIAQRKRFLAEATKEDWLVAGAHLSFPGFGRVRQDGAGYRWVPAHYAIPAGARQR